MHVSLRVALPALLLTLGCGVRASEDGSPSQVDVDDRLASEHEDGETGVGIFETRWGTAKLDYQWRGGLMIHDGDIVLEPSTELRVEEADLANGLGQAGQPLLQAAKKWEMVGGVVKVPYSFALELSANRRKQVRDAMDEWEHAIGFLAFVESSATTGRRVKFVAWDKQYCYVDGSPTDEGKVYTSGGCTWITYVHEIGHVLGFKHEQKRIDRETYVHYDKAKTCQPSEFSFFDGNELGTYDAESIMHYPSCTFAISTGLCGGSGTCNANTPNNWVLTRKAAYGPAFIPSWEHRSAGNVLRTGDKCNFKSLYGVPCDSDGSGGTGGASGSGGSAGSSGGAGSSSGGVAGAGAGGGGAGGSAGAGNRGATGGFGSSAGTAGSSSGGAPGAAGMPSEAPAPEASDPDPNTSEGNCSATARPVTPSVASWALVLLAAALLARRFARLETQRS